MITRDSRGVAAINKSIGKRFSKGSTSLSNSTLAKRSTRPTTTAASKTTLLSNAVAIALETSPDNPTDASFLYDNPPLAADVNDGPYVTTTINSNINLASLIANALSPVTTTAPATVNTSVTPSLNISALIANALAPVTSTTVTTPTTTPAPTPVTTTTSSIGTVSTTANSTLDLASIIANAVSTTSTTITPAVTTAPTSKTTSTTVIAAPTPVVNTTPSTPTTTSTLDISRLIADALKPLPVVDTTPTVTISTPVTTTTTEAMLPAIAGATPVVVGRYVYYANTAYYGDAFASDKSVLLPNATATTANLTSYTSGINELVLDVSNATTFNASDFAVRLGQNGDPYAWATGPAPISVTAIAGIGTGGSTRVFIKWADGAIKNTWAQITYTPGSDTFYIGNLVGSVNNFQVTSDAETAARTNTTSMLGAQITSPYDFNRDGRVDAVDQLVARAANGASLPVLNAPSIPTVPTVAYDWHTQTINGALNIWAPNPSDFGTTFAVTDPTMLFGSDGVPQIESVHQGPLPDCYFLAAGASLAFSNPSRIQAMVKNDTGGGWSVTFQTYNNLLGRYVPVVIHTSNLLSSTWQFVANNEVWSLVLEKAYAAFRTWDGITSQNTMSSLGWGYGGTALTAEGSLNSTVYVASMTEQAAYNAMQSALAAGKPILFHTSSNAPTMVASHVYVITGVSTDSSGVRWVTTYNPWGFYDVRRESDLLANGIGTIIVGTN